MLTSRLIPCLDCRDGRVVKGTKFQNLRDSGDPAELATRYQQQGADELVLLDVAATPAGRGNALRTVRDVRRVLSIPLTVGGGVRSCEDAQALLQSGADKVACNSAAVERPELLRELAARFGSQCVVLAIDAARIDGGWQVVTRSGSVRTGRCVVEWARRAQQLGVGEILLTSWDRDGTGAGYDLELLAAVRDAVSLPVIASGGAKRAEDLVRALRAGASAVLVASMLHSGGTTVGDIKRELQQRDCEVRL